jgi:hypothetical protein
VDVVVLLWPPEGSLRAMHEAANSWS